MVVPSVARRDGDAAVDVRSSDREAIVSALYELPTTVYASLDLARHVFSDRLEVTDMAVESALDTSFSDAAVAWRALRTVAMTMHALHFDAGPECLHCTPMDADEVTLAWGDGPDPVAGGMLRVRYEPVREARLLVLLWFGD